MKALVGVTLSAMAFVALADAPLPPPTLVTHCTTSRSYCATSDPRVSETVTRSGVSGQAIWAVPRHFRSFQLSADGNALVALADSGNLIPQDSTLDTALLYIYRSGQLLQTVRVGDLFSSMSELDRTVSHLSWGEVLPINEGEVVVVRLSTGAQVTYSLRTGHRVPQ